MNLVLLGPPGAGKGTFANLLKERFGILHISTGDMLREEMKAGTSLGLEVKKFVETGALVPDDIIIKIIESKLGKDPRVKQGFMLDGFPRTAMQALELDKILNKIKKPVEYVLYMQASVDVVVQRLTGRRICKKCGAIYHLVNMPPKVAGICDQCGGELYQRPDDKEETIRTRLEVYSNSTAPIVDYYKKQGKLYNFDANRRTEDLMEQFLGLMKSECDKE